MGWADRLSEALMTGRPLELNKSNWMDALPNRPASIPASEIRRILVSPPEDVDPRGLTIQGAQITGELDLDHAVIGFPVSFIACRFTKPISAVDARLRSLDFSKSKLCGLHLIQAVVDGNLDLEGATLCSDANGVALSLVLARIAGGWLATDGFSAEGGIHAHGVDVAGFVILDGRLTNAADGVALSLGQAHLGGGWVSNGLQTEGGVLAKGITVDGPLRLDGSTLSNPGGVALNLEQAKIDGGLFATNGFSTEGEVLAGGLHIDGQLNLDGATLSNRSETPALDGHTDGMVALRLEQAAITGTWFARNGFRADGEIKIHRVTIGGQLDLSHATFSNPGKLAISLEQSKIGGDWLASEGLNVDGDIKASGLVVDGHLNLEGCSLLGDLDLEEVSASRLILPQTPPVGFTFLGGCEAEALATGDVPPKLGAVAGLQVQDLYGSLREDPALAIHWLRTSPWFVPQPWEELARIYSRNGQPDHARRLRVAAARETTRRSPLWTKIGRSLYGATVGYGYHPLWSIAWLTATFLAVVWIAGCSPQAFITTSTTSVGFDPWMYALATIGPASAVIPTAWAPLAPGYSWLVYALTGLKAVSWILTALFLAGITGLLRKDHA